MSGTHGFRGLNEPFPNSNIDPAEQLRATIELEKDLPAGHMLACPKCGSLRLGFSDDRTRVECLDCGWIMKEVTPHALSKHLKSVPKKDQHA